MNRDERQEIGEVLEWVKEQEQSCAEIISASSDAGFGSASAIAADLEKYQKIREILEIVLDKPGELW